MKQLCEPPTAYQGNRSTSWIPGDEKRGGGNTVRRKTKKPSCVRTRRRMQVQRFFFFCGLFCVVVLSLGACLQRHGKISPPTHSLVRISCTGRPALRREWRGGGEGRTFQPPHRRARKITSRENVCVYGMEREGGNQVLCVAVGAAMIDASHQPGWSLTLSS
jgi:hypothetical protein